MKPTAPFRYNFSVFATTPAVAYLFLVRPTPLAVPKSFERHQVEKLLRLIDNTDGLELPVCLEHRDKPDFVISTRHRRIGLETSNFTDEEAMCADHLHWTRYPKAYVTTTGLRDCAWRRSNEDLAATMSAWDAPWEDVAEGAEHVATKILESIRIKQRKFRSQSFQKFDENWLLLTDYQNPFSDRITDEILARQLSATIQRGDTKGTEFDRIYVFCGLRCFRLCGNTLSTKLDQRKV